MAVTAACAALVAVGIAIVVRWGGDPHAATEGGSGRSRRPARDVAVRVGVALAAGLAAGVLAAGAGGRLMMRLLAATSPHAQGSFTEADEIVGRITVDGTLGFIVFAGLPAGVLAGALYALVRPLLPRGRAGGALLGALLLVLAGTRLEPLRADNLDFAIVGPAWLAVLGFTALALFQGMLVVALVARMSRDSPRALATEGGRRGVTAGRIALAVLALVALPGCLAAVADILESG